LLYRSLMSPSNTARDGGRNGLRRTERFYI
jgi:hypothetical protein